MNGADTQVSTYDEHKNDKYSELLETPLIERLRHSFFQMGVYIGSNGFGNTAFIHILSIIRLFQLFGPSTMPRLVENWGKGSIYASVIQFCSLFYRLYPVFWESAIYLPILIVYCFLTIGCLILFIWGSFYFEKRAKIPKIVSFFTYFYNDGVVQIVNTGIIELYITYIKSESGFSQNLRLAILILVPLCFIINIGILYIFAVLSFRFHPTQLMTLESIIQLKIILTTYSVTTFCMLGSTETRYRIFFLIMAFTSYGLNLRFVFKCGGLIRVLYDKIYLAFSISGPLILIAHIIFITFKFNNPDILLVFLMGSSFLGYLLSSSLIKYKHLTILSKLDYFLDNPNESLELDVCELGKLSVIGFHYAHPLCLNWTLFSKNINQYMSNFNFWIIYIKFLSIYPEESLQLDWVNNQLYQVETNCIEREIASIYILSCLKQRDSNMSPKLRAILNECTKKSSLARRKMRSVWELVLQHDIKDMEIWLSRSSNQVEEAEIEFTKTMQLFSNNKYVTRSYLRFLKDVKHDFEAYNEWTEKMMLLKQGIPLYADSAHENGVTTFPMIPTSLKARANPGVNSESLLDSENEFLDDNTKQNEHYVFLKRLVSSVTIPSITKSKWIYILIFIFISILPSIILYFVSLYFINEFHVFSNILYYLSFFRNINFQFTTFGLRLVGESIVINETTDQRLIPHVPFNDYPLNSFGNKTDTRDQIRILLSYVNEILNGLSPLRVIKLNNALVGKARSICYENTVNGTLFLTANTTTVFKASALTLFLRSSTQMVSFSDSNSSLSGMRGLGAILNITKDVPATGNALNEALQAITDYISESNEYYQSLFSSLLTYGILFICLVVILSLYYQIVSIENNKEIVFRCLFSLPKNVVSAASESLRPMTKDLTDSKSSISGGNDMNKQEENILKLFSSTGESRDIFGNQLLLVFASLTLAMISSYSYFQMIKLIKNERNAFTFNAPHYNNVLGTIGYLNWGLSSMINLVLSMNGYQQSHKSLAWLLNAVESKFVIMRKFYNQARFGGVNDWEMPFIGFQDIDNAITNSEYCNDTDSGPKTDRYAFSCMNLEMSFYLVESMVGSVVKPLRNGSKVFPGNQTLIADIWNLGALVLYDKFFYKLHNSILPTMEDSIVNSLPSYKSQIAILFSICLLLIVITLVYLSHLERVVLFAFQMLLQCNIQDVLSNRQIMLLLSGNFSMPKINNTERNDKYYISVVEHLPDGVFVVDNNGKIEWENESIRTIIGKKSLIQSHVADLLSQLHPIDTINEKYSVDDLKSKGGKFQYTMDDGSKKYLLFCILSFHEKNMYVVRDISIMFNHQILIDDERKKSDKLLSAILPPQLIARVQNEEKNISFSVQSGSVIFIDIVEFTPWCSSNTAERIMHVLNCIFKLFDSALQKYQSLSKIKCIGDCYMAAGGIFTEINQPFIHAKEALDFCLEALAIIKQINVEKGENLRIRIGIHTGGPIVAGVMGIEKPTFEILGPTISFAQQMEHHGLPMQIHISRPVYELIYGGHYKIKERGRMDIKETNIQTYLVSQ